MTVNSATFHVPESRLIKTQSLDQTVGNISFTDLMSPAQRSIIGGATEIAWGKPCTAASPRGPAARQLRGIVGVRGVGRERPRRPPHGRRGRRQQYQHRGEHRRDEHRPALAGNGPGRRPERGDARRLRRHEGLLLEAEGYLLDGALQATIVATAQILVFPEGSDTVGITTTRCKNGEIRVTGEVAPVAEGKNVTIYPGTVNGTGTGCTSTTAIASVPVDAANGAYSARFPDTSNFCSVGVRSSGGGAKEAPVSNG